MRHWQETYNQTGVLRLGHPRGQKAVNNDLLFNRTPFTLDGASLTVHLMPRIYNSLWHLRFSHPCRCDQKTGCATRRELDRCLTNRELMGYSPYGGGHRVPTAVVTTFWTASWSTNMTAKPQAQRLRSVSRGAWNRSATSGLNSR